MMRLRMKPQPDSSTQEVLAGLVERVTYHNEDNGFCVLRIKARGHRELVTVIGHAAVISAGEWVAAQEMVEIQGSKCFSLLSQCIRCKRRTDSGFLNSGCFYFPTTLALRPTAAECH